MEAFESLGVGGRGYNGCSLRVVSRAVGNLVFRSPIHAIPFHIGGCYRNIVDRTADRALAVRGGFDMYVVKIYPNL